MNTMLTNKNYLIIWKTLGTKKYDTPQTEGPLTGCPTGRLQREQSEGDI